MKPQWLKDLEARNDRDEFSIVANMSESQNWRLLRKKPDGSRDVFDTGVPITENTPLDAEALRSVLPSDVKLSTVSDEDIEELERQVEKSKLLNELHPTQVIHFDADEEVPIPLTRIIRDASDVARDLGNHTAWLERHYEALSVTADTQGRKLARIADVFGEVKLDEVVDARGALEAIRAILLERDPGGETVSVERMTLEFAQLQGRLQVAESRLAQVSMSLFEGSPEPTLENLRGILSA